MKTYCVKNQADLAKIPSLESFHLEIYLKNAVIPWRQIYGNCFIRAQNCHFPHLETVYGHLSIDAAGASLPHLEQVEGDCNVHEPHISLPKLKEVKGKLKILQPIHLLALEKVGNKLENTANVALPKLISVTKPVIEIKNKIDIAQIPADGYCSLLICADNIIIENQIILGNITIKGNNIQFPNLLEVKKLLIGDPHKGNVIQDLSFPSLIKIRENCIITYAENVIFAVLKEIGQQLLVHRSSTCFFYNLEKVGIFNINSGKRFLFPKLKLVAGDFYCRELGSDDTVDEYPVLEAIHGTLQFSHHLRFPKLKKIRVLETIRAVEKVMDEHFPNIERINFAVYNPFFGALVEKVEHLFFKITENVHVSSQEFIIGQLWRPIFKEQRFPMTTMISILKMRHTTFQNFYTREFERIWAKPHPQIEAIASIIEKKWDNTPKFTFKHLFSLSHRNLRRFSFLYIGVSEMMKALDAKRIATKGIELNYYKYDSLGNKIPFTKHNLFEIYEASVKKLQDLQTWRVQDGKIYAVKCWCTSTNQEHWLWVEEKYKKNPLAAIASTFRIHENVIPHIKCLKRQGDVLICEMKREVIPSGAIRPLTAKEYFGLLEVET